VTAGHRGKTPREPPHHHHKIEQTTGHNPAVRLLRVKSGDIRPR
jgi:hypothetical protein